MIHVIQSPDTDSTFLREVFKTKPRLRVEVIPRDVRLVNNQRIDEVQMSAAVIHDAIRELNVPRTGVTVLLLLRNVSKIPPPSDLYLRLRNGHHGLLHVLVLSSE
ncbi:hypothetical protein D3C86_1574760 [compost metagenome]